MKAKKSLGQNFLIDTNVINNISKVINVQENDLIIEIGPGKGALTKELIKKNCYVICYEIDIDLKEYLNTLENTKTKIIFQDILQSNIEEDIKDITYNNLFVVGNLPYYITTPIIKYLINTHLNISEMVFMVQDEVADRFSSKPNSKDYGSITLYLQYYYDITKLFKVSKNSFNPIPKVESAIIKMVKRKELLNVNEDKYFKLINDSFKLKRKTLKNNLKDYDFQKIIPILNKYNLSENVRAEEIPENVFADISNNI